jgi:hypothetical protein
MTDRASEFMTTREAATLLSGLGIPYHHRSLYHPAVQKSLGLVLYRVGRRLFLRRSDVHALIRRVEKRKQ